MNLGSALGTVEYWKDFWDIDLSGPGEYPDGEGGTVTIQKSHHLPRPKEKEQKIGALTNQTHWSVVRYGYGTMWFGRFEGQIQETTPITTTSIQDLEPSPELEALILQYGIQNLRVGPVVICMENGRPGRTIMFTGDGKCCKVGSIYEKTSNLDV